MGTATHWQHQPHAVARIVTEYNVRHAGPTTIIEGSTTFECPRADCPGIPPGLGCKCGPTTTQAD